jgi:hypothetical protein
MLPLNPPDESGQALKGASRAQGLFREFKGERRAKKEISKFNLYKFMPLLVFSPTAFCPWSVSSPTIREKRFLMDTMVFLSFILTCKILRFVVQNNITFYVMLFRLEEY